MHIKTQTSPNIEGKKKASITCTGGSILLNYMVERAERWLDTFTRKLLLHLSFFTMIEITQMLQEHAHILKEVAKVNFLKYS